MYKPSDWDRIAHRHRSADQIARVTAALEILPRNRPVILDAGCGDGELLSRTQETGNLVLGTDISLEACRLSAARVGSAGIIQADLCSLPFRRSVVNAVCLIDVIEHIPVPGQALKEIYRVLSHDGVLIMTTPNGFPLCLARLEDRAKGRRSGGQWQPYDHLFSPKQVIEIVRNAGFSEIRVRGFNRRLSRAPLYPALRRIPILRNFLCASILIHAAKSDSC